MGSRCIFLFAGCTLRITHNRTFSSCLHVFWSKLLAWRMGSLRTCRRVHRGRVVSCEPRPPPFGCCPRACMCFIFIEVPKGHPQPGSPKDGPCKGPNEVRLNTDAPKVHPLALFFLFFVAHGPLRSPAR